MKYRIFLTIILASMTLESISLERALELYPALFQRITPDNYAKFLAKLELSYIQWHDFALENKKPESFNLVERARKLLLFASGSFEQFLKQLAEDPKETFHYVITEIILRV